MNSLDEFILGKETEYVFKQYDIEYTYAKVSYRNRFILLFEICLQRVLDYANNSKFKGLFDTKTNILYVESDFYNTLYKESEFKKQVISDLSVEIVKQLKLKYNEYIKENQQDLKALAYPKFKQYYSIKENNTSLRQELETKYKENVSFDEFPTFEINHTPNLYDIIDYITDSEQYIWNIINKDLDRENYNISSYYAGIADIPATHREYIGFKLLKQDKLNEMAQDIANNKDECSAILNKARAISNFISKNSEIKNVVVGLTYKDESIEITYPMLHLRRLELDSYYMPVKDREKFYNMFAGLNWGDRDTILNSIQYFKYRGKIIWTTNKD